MVNHVDQCAPTISQPLSGKLSTYDPVLKKEETRGATNSTVQPRVRSQHSRWQEILPFIKITEVPSGLQNALGILRQLHLLQAQELSKLSPALQILIHILLPTNLASVSSAVLSSRSNDSK